MSNDNQTQTGTGSARPFRRRRTRMGLNDKKIQDDEFMAAAIGDVEWLRQSLRDQNLQKGEIHYDKNGLTALHLAAIHGRHECLKLLIEKYKLDINLASSTGWRAIHLCISNQTGKRAVQCLQYLLDKKADASVENDDGITPVHQAASEGHVQCLKMLIDHGATIDGEDCRKHTPLDLAKLWGHRKCARIIAAEMWQQGKDQIAKEMRQLRKLKMQQVLREMELEAEYKATNEHYSEEAFTKWLEEKGYDKDMATGPKPKDAKAKEKDKKDSLKSDREPLMKPNSVTSKGTSNKDKDLSSNRRPDSIPTWKAPRRELSPPSRKATNMTLLAEEDIDEGIYEGMEDRDDQGATSSMGRSAGYVNPVPWKIPLKVDDPPYITNLTDDYPRDEYTMMPQVETAPKFYDGWHGPRLYKKDVQEGMVDTKKKLRKPKLPPETIQKVMDKDSTLGERPMVFKARHIADVHMKKKYDDAVMGKSEVSFHLGDDMSSLLFKNSVRSEALLFDVAAGSKRDPKKDKRHNFESNSILTSHPNTRSSSSSHWSSMKFPRERVINSLRNMGRPTNFPNINKEEYDIGTQVRA